MSKNRSQDSAVNLVYQTVYVWEQKVSLEEYFVAGLNLILEQRDLYCTEIFHDDFGISVQPQWKWLVMAAGILSSMKSHPRD